MVNAEMGYHINTGYPMQDWAVSSNFPESQEPIKPYSEKRNSTIFSVDARKLMLDLNDDPQNWRTIGQVSYGDWEDLLHGIDTVYMMGIFAPSKAAAEYERIKHPETKDIAPSPFAISEDSPNPDIAETWNEWDIFVRKMEEMKIKVLIDFVPNHVAFDHPWVKEHLDYFIEVSEEEFNQHPERYYEVKDDKGNSHYLARAKQIDSSGKVQVWGDVLQLNYANPKLRKAMIERAKKLIPHAHGFRIDTAPLVVDKIFKQTWKDEIPNIENYSWDFWKEFNSEMKNEAWKQGKDFLLMGEAYEHHGLLHDDFDVLYNAALYDALKQSNAWMIKNQLYDLSRHASERVVFLTNHDIGHDKNLLGNVDKLRAVLIVLAASPANWMMQHNEAFGRPNVPLQQYLYKEESKLNENQISALTVLYQTLKDLRYLSVFQTGSYDVIETGNEIIAQKYKSEHEGMIVCTNMFRESLSCLISMPPGITKEQIKVYDVENRKFLDQETIADPAALNGQFYIQLEPYRTQIVFLNNQPKPESVAVGHYAVH